MRDINFKGVGLALCIIVLGLVTTGWIKNAMAQKDTAGVMTELEKNILLRTDAQLQLMQQKFQKEAQPIMDEQNALLKKKCGEVKAVPGTDCEVNIQTGTVKKTPPKK